MGRSNIKNTDVPRTVFTLRKKKGLTFAEIGDSLGFSRQRAKQAYDEHLLSQFKKNAERSASNEI